MKNNIVSTSQMYCINYELTRCMWGHQPKTSDKQTSKYVYDKIKYKISAQVNFKQGERIWYRDSQLYNK